MASDSDSSNDESDDVYEYEELELDDLEHLLTRVETQTMLLDMYGLENLMSRVGIEARRVNSFAPLPSSYSFGKWGYHTNDHDSQFMPGFSSTPPGAEICGRYKIIYVAALEYDEIKQQANIILRREPEWGSLVIQESSEPFTIGVDGRIGTPRPPSRRVTSPTIFSGEVSLPSEKGSMIDRYFGLGYRFYGFEANSEATSSYNSMAANASLIVTKRNDIKGRLYRVEQPKAFKLLKCETGVVADESTAFDSQDHESNEARRVCKCRHFSFLCRELGLPCSASALITLFVRRQPFFIFAEPGDVWIAFYTCQNICIGSQRTLK